VLKSLEKLPARIQDVGRVIAFIGLRANRYGQKRLRGVYNMFSWIKRHTFSWTMTLGITLMLTGCLKKPCQDLVTEPYSTFTEVEWRLVETNDPAQAGTLSNFTFTTITFELSFEGEIKPYINNRELDENVTPFAYQVFSRPGRPSDYLFECS